jgi:hypothetical protein
MKPELSGITSIGVRKGCNVAHLKCPLHSSCIQEVISCIFYFAIANKAKADSKGSPFFYLKQP